MSNAISQARKYVNGLARFKSDGNILEEDLRVMSQILLDLQHCRIVTEDNMRVLNHLRKFYSSLPRRLRSLGLTWHGDIQAGVGVLVGRLRPIIARTGSMLERIAVLERLTGSRADYVGFSTACSMPATSVCASIISSQAFGLTDAIRSTDTKAYRKRNQ